MFFTTLKYEVDWYPYYYSKITFRSIWTPHDWQCVQNYNGIYLLESYKYNLTADNSQGGLVVAKGCHEYVTCPANTEFTVTREYDLPYNLFDVVAGFSIRGQEGLFQACG